MSKIEAQKVDSTNTECVTDLYYCNEMIIFKSILTIFFVFRDSSDGSYNWLEPKIEPPSANLACPHL